VIKFLPAVILFYLSLLANGKLLESANVETFIAVRSLTPIIVSVIEPAFFGLPKPSQSTIASLLVIVAGAVAYVLIESDFELKAYSWAAVYLLAISVDMLLIKKVVNDVKLTPWGLVYYNNFLALLFAPLGIFATNDFGCEGAKMNIVSFVAIAVSCILGVSISFFALSARKAFSATSFTVLGVVNKFATVLINTVVWSHHASVIGVLCILVCIVGGILYQKSVEAQQQSVQYAKARTKIVEGGEEEEIALPQQPEQGSMFAFQGNYLQIRVSLIQLSGVFVLLTIVLWVCGRE